MGSKRLLRPLCAAVLIAFGAGACESTQPARSAAGPRPSSSRGASNAAVSIDPSNQRAALQRYRQILAENPSHDRRMEALYHIAVIQLALDADVRNFSDSRSKLGEVKVKSDYKAVEVEAILEILVALEETRTALTRARSSARGKDAALRQKDAELAEKEKALQELTEALMRGQ